ncbi:hypothetical protein KUTeg_011038 [Tegillarca granosa]|uniref:Monocarboxylate transporter 10 n=1 Tax=Tegillarca granosa TaxID=220873 RepID=A0ABQ9F7S0_TEGGR|nr:hypothetical protein KUTeg_011038 [Tegillarca granosa]
MTWIGSVGIGMTFLMCMLSSISCDVIGIRQTSILGATIGSSGLLISAFVTNLDYLFLSFGFIFGIGNAFILCPSVVILGHYFKKRIGLANGLVSSGTAVLIILLSFALPQLLTHFRIKYMFLFLSGFYFLLIFSSLTFIPLPSKKENHEKVKKLRNICNVDIWKNKVYVIWAISVSVVCIGFNVPVVHMVKYLTGIFPDEDITFYVTLRATIVSIGRLVFGKVSDFKSVNRMYLQQSAFVVLGLGLIIIPWIRDYIVFITLNVITGIFIGVSMSLNGPIAFDIFGHKASQAIGFLYGMMAIPSISGPPIAGKHSYLNDIKIYGFYNI